MYVLAVLVVLFMLMGLSAGRRLSKMISSDDLKELMKDAQKTEQSK